MSLPKDFVKKLNQNRTDGLFVDFQLLCDGQVINVHKIILCSYSPVFLAALSSSYQESEKGAYKIKDSSYYIVVEMVIFMYTGSYEASAENPTAVDEGLQEVLFHAAMVALADKYLIPSLQKFALSKFKICVDSEEDFRPLLHSVSEVYAIDGDGSAELRRILVSRFVSGFALHIDENGMEDLLREISMTSPQFAIDLATALLLSARAGYSDPW